MVVRMVAIVRLAHDSIRVYVTTVYSQLGPFEIRAWGMPALSSVLHFSGRLGQRDGLQNTTLKDCLHPCRPRLTVLAYLYLPASTGGIDGSS
jgi:hypothetical protein